MPYDNPEGYIEEFLMEEEAPGPDQTVMDVQNVVKRSVEEAIQHFEENIEPEMAKATDYYYGRPFGDEKAGRSQVVSTDVRDATLDQIPELIEIFMGSDSVVEFKPRAEAGAPGARQATDTVNYVFFEDNPGFLVLNSVLKDAGVRRLGYTKWWWDEYEEVRGTTMSGLTEEELMYLASEEVEFEITGMSTDTVQGEQGPQEVPVYSAEIRYQQQGGRVRVETVPPEEIVWTPEARSFDTAPCVAHVREVPKDFLLKLGIEDQFIEDNRGVKSSRSTESLAWARHFYGSSSQAELSRSDQQPGIQDGSQEAVLYSEVYQRIDTDGDGIGELRMFQCVGPDFEIWNGNGLGELVDEVPFAPWTPDPEPHTIPGLCNYDLLKEIQRVKSQIQRGQLNSLAQSIEQQMVVAQNEVNIRDLISPEISGIIRVKRDVNNSIREIKHSFVGGDTLPVLEYYDQIKADRIGRKGPREGMDANIMQSTTAEAVGATLSRSQQRIRMLARVYAETGLKATMRGIFRLLIRHQNRERTIQLRGEYVQVNPKAWDSMMDVSVNVALGTGSKMEQIKSVQMMIAEIKKHIEMGSPLTDFEKLRSAYAKLSDLMGYKDTGIFFKPWGPEQQAQFEKQQAEAAEKQKDPPEQRIVDVEELKIQLDAQEKERQHELEQLKIRLEDDRERDKMAREFALKEYELELKHQSEIEDRKLAEKVSTDRKASSTKE